MENNITITQMVQLFSDGLNDTTNGDPYEYYRFMTELAPKLSELLGDTFNQAEYLAQIAHLNPWRG